VSGLSWKYQQSTGWLLGTDGSVFKGYSGAEPEGFNNPAMQEVHNIGPIPQGMYTIEAPMDTEAHGPYALPLIPVEGNQMFGRSSFLMHGDSIESPGTASEGCVIMARAIRQIVWNSTDHVLQVIA
jgi:Protein of unknown function (DUF2778)